MGLRLAEGVRWPAAGQFGDADLKLNDEWLDRFIAEGWLVVNDEKLSTSLEGRLRLDIILSHLLD